MSESVKTILLVEDEALIAMYEAQQLETAGYAVVTAYSGKDAINQVKTPRQKIDLILMDINLGAGIDGTEAAQIILKDHDIPVVFLSSHTQPEVVEKTEQITSYGYVVKNSGINVLDASIKMAFKLYSAHQIIQEANDNLKQEIRDRNEIEKELRKSEARFRSLFMSMTEGFYLSEVIYDASGNPCDYKYLEVNPKFESVLGLSRDQIIGKRYKEIVPEDTTQWLENYFHVALTGEPRTFEFYSPEYDMHFMTYSYQPEKDQVSVFVIDITENKQAKVILQQAIAEKEILMRELQHRVKNSLRTAVGLLKLEHDNLPDDRTKAIFTNTETRLNYITMLYDQINQMDRVDRINMQKYLQTQINTMLKAYLTPESPINIDSHIDALELDPGRAMPLGLLMNELITNAIKYAFPSGEQGTIRIQLTEQDGMITLCVRDNGVGILPGSEQSQNSGLGLKLVEMLVEQLSAKRTVENDQGTKVCITFKK